MEQSITDFNPIYVYVVYALTWLVLFGYLYYLAKKQKSIETQLQDLKNIIDSTKP